MCVLLGARVCVCVYFGIQKSCFCHFLLILLAAGNEECEGEEEGEEEEENVMKRGRNETTNSLSLSLLFSLSN